MTARECANGRRRYRSGEEAAQLAAEFEASGPTRPQFCQRHGVSLNTLARYRQRRRQHKAPRQNQTPPNHSAAPGQPAAR